jgi:hypothetical protein
MGSLDADSHVKSEIYLALHKCLSLLFRIVCAEPCNRHCVLHLYLPDPNSFVVWCRCCLGDCQPVASESTSRCVYKCLECAIARAYVSHRVYLRRNRQVSCIWCVSACCSLVCTCHQCTSRPNALECKASCVSHRNTTKVSHYNMPCHAMSVSVSVLMAGTILIYKCV